MEKLHWLYVVQYALNIKVFFKVMCCNYFCISFVVVVSIVPAF